MPTIIPVTDPADPRIAAYRDIRERDLVGREGLFVAEGKVVLTVLLASSTHRPQSLLIAEHRVAALADQLRNVPAEVPVYSASQEVLDTIAGFSLHRGILAMGRRIAVPSADDLLTALPAQAAILVLSAVSNHDNMGGIFRNAAAFGTPAILLDADCCDPLYRKSIRVSVGAALLVPFAFVPRGADLIDLVVRHGFSPIALTPQGGARLADLKPGPRTAILLGAEGPGLAADLIARAQSISIPMAPGFDSLNVAVTSGIVLHHLVAHPDR
jgi:tRNA G18 (ribose-2'-O)-methylase SpoU